VRREQNKHCIDVRRVR